MPLDAATAAFLENFDDKPPHEIPIEQFRAAVAGFGDVGFTEEPVAEVYDIQVPVVGGTVRVRVYRPDAGDALPIMVCAHGGGWVRGSIDAAEGYYRLLANRTSCVIAAVEYRLAPEFPFPTPLEDVYAVCRFMQENAASHGGDPSCLVVLGESAGGNIAAACALLAKERGDVELTLQVLIEAALDLRLASPTWTSMDGKYGVRREYVDWQAGQYANGVNRTHPHLSPLCAADHTGLAPALIITAEYDPLVDEGAQYAEVLRAAGVPVMYWEIPGLIHHALLIPKVIPLAEDAAAGLAKRVVEALAATRA